MYTRKKLPKTQYEISTGANQKTYQRENDVRRDNDKLKDFSIGLFDLDFAIKYYFDEVIKPQVNDQGNQIKVPVIHGAPEKWKNIQADGYLRDKNGKIQVPIIAYKRNTIQKDKTLGSKVDPNYPQIYFNEEVRYTKENVYDKFSVLTNSKPIKTFVNTVIPDFVTITYDVVLWTDYIEQMNQIVESIIYTEGGYWGEKERFKFRSKIDDFTNTTDLMQDSDRVVRTNFTLTLFGQIVTDSLAKELSYKQSSKTFDTRQVVLENEVDPDPSLFKTTDRMETNFLSPSIQPSQSPIAPNPVLTSLSVNVLNYLSTNLAITADTKTTSTAVFNNYTVITRPLELPPTGQEDVVVFVNGQYVEPTAIVSITDDSTNITIVFDVGQLGFTLAATDEIVAVGKFAPLVLII